MTYYIAKMKDVKENPSLVECKGYPQERNPTMDEGLFVHATWYHLVYWNRGCMLGQWKSDEIIFNVAKERSSLNS